MANGNLPPDVQKAALDLMIAVKKARGEGPHKVAAPVDDSRHHVNFLEMTAEALLATAHLILAGAVTPKQEVQDAVRTLAEQGRAAHERTSLDELMELRRKVVG